LQSSDRIMESLFREDYLRGNGGEAFPIDRKRRRRLTEKKRFISRGRKFFCVFKIGSSIQLELDM